MELLDAETLDEITEQVRAILRGRAFRSGDARDRQEAGDLEQEAVASVLQRLAQPAERIDDLRGYVAVVTYNVWNAWLRRKHPRRWRMETRVQYLLRHAERVREWTSEQNEWLASIVPAEASIADMETLRTAMLTTTPQPFAPFVVELLSKLRCAVRVRELIEVLVERFDPAGDESLGQPAAESDVEERLVWRGTLAAAWREIAELPLHQRIALLLGLRGEGGEALLKLLPVTRVASIREIAATLAIEPRELASLWLDLPLDDRTIAGRLGLTRQQVINLRKSARDRLRRRVPESGGTF